MNTSSSAKLAPKKLPLGLALFPVVLLILALSWNVYVFGDDALAGSSQMVIILVTAVAGAIGLARGVSWQQQQQAVVSMVAAAAPSIIILLLVGALASSWLLSGTVPTLVYFGIKLLGPAIFLVACCIACALTSLATGSSWSTAATIGVAMVGIGRAMNIPDGLIGGAIISGAYFGDKVSPLSDTTNLAAAVSDVPLFAHIRYLLLTSGPSFAISLIAFALIGVFIDTGDTGVSSQQVLDAIDARFQVNLLTLLPAVVTLTLIVRKVDAIPALVVGILCGVLTAVIFQGALLNDLMQNYDNFAFYSVLMVTLYGGVDIVTSNALLNDLFSASGMEGMLGTVWLIVVAMAFGGVLSACGMIERIMDSLRAVSSHFFGLISATAGTCLLTNISTSDQYISVTIPGRMFADTYRDNGYDKRNLSRTLEDSGTVTSVLIPWNTCGAYHASVLGIATLTYLPYCFFNLLSPIMTLLFAWFKIKIAKAPE